MKYQDELLREAYIYLDSDSIEEFRIRRAAEGIHRRKLNDAFLAYYLCVRFKWLRESEHKAYVFLLMSGVVLVFTPFPWAAIPSSWRCLSPAAFTTA